MQGSSKISNSFSYKNIYTIFMKSWGYYIVENLVHTLYSHNRHCQKMCQIVTKRSWMNPKEHQIFEFFSWCECVYDEFVKLFEDVLCCNVLLFLKKIIHLVLYLVNLFFWAEVSWDWRRWRNVADLIQSICPGAEVKEQNSTRVEDKIRKPSRMNSIS